SRSARKSRSGGFLRGSTIRGGRGSSVRWIWDRSGGGMINYTPATRCFERAIQIIRGGISSDWAIKKGRAPTAFRPCSHSYLIKRCGARRSNYQNVRAKGIMTIRPPCVVAILWRNYIDSCNCLMLGVGGGPQ